MSRCCAPPNAAPPPAPAPTPSPPRSPATSPKHAAEETHHDEWLLDDYAAIGGDPAALAAEPGSPTAAALVGSQYYWIHRAHPVAILGYCVVLEGSPPTGLFVSQLELATGYPPTAFATLRHHSTVDLDHRRKLFDLIDTLPLTPQHEALIGMAALQTADLLIAAATTSSTNSAPSQIKPALNPGLPLPRASPTAFVGTAGRAELPIRAVNLSMVNSQAAAPIDLARYVAAALASSGGRQQIILEPGRLLPA